VRLTSQNLSLLARHLGYDFHSEPLLEQALTHRSVGTVNNERLEYLGDGALNFIIASELYHLKSTFNEGELSRMRANLVRKETLAEIAAELELGPQLNLGSGELKSGGYERDSILGDTVEAILGAVYLDGGFDQCKRVVQRLYARRLSDLPDVNQLKDSKTRLQEYLQGRQFELPEYKVVEKSGKAHEQQFLVQCVVVELDISLCAKALGRRRAEQAVAQKVLEKLGVS
jgi:ribonuclease-3